MINDTSVNLLDDEKDNAMVMLPRGLVDEIIHTLTFLDGVYCTDKIEVLNKCNHDFFWRTDETVLSKKIEEYL